MGDKGDMGDKEDKGHMLNQAVGKSLSVHSCRPNCRFPRINRAFVVILNIISRLLIFGALLFLSRCFLLFSLFKENSERAWTF